MSIALRIRQLRDVKNLNQSAFALALEVSQAAISRYEKAERLPDSDFLAKVSSIWSVNTNWLLTGEGEMFNVSRARESIPSKFIDIDIIPDIAAGMGYDCSYSEPLYTLSLPAHLLHRPGPFYGFRVTGDSMEPDIKDQDVVILSGNWEGVSPDGKICGFRNSDGMVLKRLVLDHKKKAGWLFSLNQEYKPIRYENNDQDLVMIGILCALIRDYLLE